MPTPGVPEGGGPDTPALPLRIPGDPINVAVLAGAPRIGGDEVPAVPPISVLQRRWRKFKALKRGYWAFLLLVGLYLVSFALPLLINDEALIVSYNGSLSFPVLEGVHLGSDYGVVGPDATAPTRYRTLKHQWDSAGSDNWILMPPYAWDPDERDQETVVMDEEAGVPREYPYPPSSTHWLGTDMNGRDVFARMAYGFNISISFALLLTALNYIIGTILGGLMGYYGRWIDLAGQRLLEVWSNIPFLFLVIMVSSIMRPTFALLVLLLTLFGWIGSSYLMRGEFLREKAKDYVAAAISLGATDRQVIFKHILPNALTPIIAGFPFAIVGGIATLVGLDFLGFGLQGKLPSWGEMVQIGNQNMEHVWLILSPSVAIFVTLLLLVFIGEAIREAFDPKVFSRLR